MFSLKPERMARYPADKYRRARRSLELFADAVQAVTPEDETSFTTATLIWTFLHGVITMLQAGRIDRRVNRKELVELAISRIVDMC